MAKSPLTSGVLLPDSYGRSGPFGELLWLLLRRLKVRFIFALVKMVGLKVGRDSSERGLTGFRSDFRRAISASIRDAKRQLATEHAQRLDVLCARWPQAPNVGESVEEMARLRLQQQGRFLDSLALIADDFDSKSKEAPWDYQFARFFCECLWPYYFLRVSGDALESEDRLLTWMPHVKLLAKTFSVAPTDGPDFKNSSLNSLLYPSLKPVLDQGPGGSLHESLSYWCDLGLSNVREDRLAIDRNLDIGHVQTFSEDRHSRAQYMGAVLQQSPDGSKLSDYFYLNTSAVVLPQRAQESGEISGVTFWCSPLPDLWPNFFGALRNPGSFKRGRSPRAAASPDWLATLDEHTTRCWGSISGPLHEEILLKRYRDHTRLQRESALGVQQRFSSMAVAGISHTLKNTITRRIDGETPEVVVGLYRCIYIEMTASYSFLKQKADVVPWASSGVRSDDRDRPLSRDLERCFSHARLPLRFDDSAVLATGLTADYRLLAVLVELARNMSKWSNVEGAATLGSFKLSPTDSGGIAFEATTQGYLKHVHNLLDRIEKLPDNLARNDPNLEMRGMACMLVLLGTIAQGPIRITIGSCAAQASATLNWVITIPDRAFEICLERCPLPAPSDDTDDTDDAVFSIRYQAVCRPASEFPLP